MSGRLAILAIFAGLGTLISCSSSANAQAAPSGLSQATATPEVVSPFDRYLELETANLHEQSLKNFAVGCGIELPAAKAKYSQRPGDTWDIVTDLSKTKEAIATDLFSTAEVWHQGDRVLLEQWGMSLDTGDLSRSFVCLNKNQTVLAESTQWSFAGFGDTVDDVTWGVVNVWKIDDSGQLALVKTRFVDLEEKTVAPPKLSAQILKDVHDAKFTAKTWADLALPNEMLK